MKLNDTMQYPFSDKDLSALQKRGLDQVKMAKNRKHMEYGFPMISLADNCKPGSEIKILNADEDAKFIERFDAVSGKNILKFVPASGAASRMFKELHQAISEKGNPEIEAKFSEGLNRFAFAEFLRANTGNNPSTKELIAALLSPEGLNYAALPKGSILFHKYDNGKVCTAFEEHFYEAAAYAKSGDTATIHFTIPAAFEVELKAFLAETALRLEEELNTKFKIETSIQKSETDSPAIYADTGEWVRGDDDELFFRPAGHGSLLENIDELDADIVFVKNIDNVVNERLKDSTTYHKKRLGGILLFVQEEIFRFLNQLDNGSLEKTACVAFAKEWLSTDISEMSDAELRVILMRPIRVCGMVKNQGEPGGGPFLVKESNGNPSLQIVEKAQINLDDPIQKSLLEKATHFNPVDLVLAVKDYRGNAFDLKQFSNPNTGMVVEKSYRGKTIKALELPGLWNGSMHNWNTVFVEVPLETFNPVKTVFDLLRPAHL